MQMTTFKRKARLKRFLPQILGFLMAGIMLQGCANYYKELGDTQYQNIAYAKAAKYYEKSYLKKANPDVALKLADCYRNNNNYAQAEKYYALGVKDSKNPLGEARLAYGKVLMSLGKYNEAQEQFKGYLSDKPGDFAAQLMLNSCSDLGQFMKDTTRYSVKNANINGLASAYSPTPYKDGIVVVGEESTKKASKQNPATLNSFQDLYFVKKDKDGKFSKPEALKGKINGEYHQGPASFSSKGNVVYFTNNNSEGIKASEKYELPMMLKIQMDSLVNNEWQTAADFPYNSKEYSCQHPCLSPDGNRLYFSSNMPGGQGGFDLWVCNLENGQWGKPENLGVPVNTALDEGFPFFSEKGKLYFSSNGHKSMGGTDVLVSKYESGRYTMPMNLNYPLNTKADDFGFILNADGKTGYLSSNRAGTDMIYEFVINPPVLYAKGKITSEQQPLAGASVVFVNKSAEITDSVITDSNGEYSFKLLEESDYTIHARKADYFPRTIELSTKGKEDNATIQNDFDLKKPEVEKPIVLEGPGQIFYDFNKYKLRKEAFPVLDNVVKFLADNPAIRIELGAHTDARGTDKYNQRLSDRRARSAFDYIVKKGIKKDRIEYKGFGESMLVNDCKDGVKCTDELHQQNRRTEFKILK